MHKGLNPRGNGAEIDDALMQDVQLLEGTVTEKGNVFPGQINDGGMFRLWLGLGQVLEGRQEFLTLGIIAQDRNELAGLVSGETCRGGWCRGVCGQCPGGQGPEQGQTGHQQGWQQAAYEQTGKMPVRSGPRVGVRYSVSHVDTHLLFWCEAAACLLSGPFSQNSVRILRHALVKGGLIF
ncbi:hypothetical protein SACS_0488 [Parasaccharibacter apium]|uniref:Uncharacterized protein n=1 Tax=Parasaccharibacter apium TaxID=1510841 RepID=A0A7U7J0M5_9PROT|nr:hypothetical protein SACS_0488 [Parasaccharibacter apium]